MVPFWGRPAHQESGKFAQERDDNQSWIGIILIPTPKVSAIHERVIQGNASTSIFNQTMKYSLTTLALMLCVRRHSA